jgi:hypothetical protein
MRHAAIVVSIWVASLLAVAFAGYILASTGPMGEIGREAAHSGRNPALIARERGIAGLLESMEETSWRLNAFFFPAVAALFGAMIGVWSRNRTALITAIAIAPLLGFIAESQSVSIEAVGWCVLYLATALAVGFAVSRIRQRSTSNQGAATAG